MRKWTIILGGALLACAAVVKLVSRKNEMEDLAEVINEKIASGQYTKGKIDPEGPPMNSIEVLIDNQTDQPNEKLLFELLLINSRRSPARDQIIRNSDPDTRDELMEWPDVWLLAEMLGNLSDRGYVLRAKAQVDKDGGSYNRLTFSVVNLGEELAKLHNGGE